MSFASQARNILGQFGMVQPIVNVLVVNVAASGIARQRARRSLWCPDLCAIEPKFFGGAFHYLGSTDRPNPQLTGRIHAEHGRLGHGRFEKTRQSTFFRESPRWTSPFFEV